MTEDIYVWGTGCGAGELLERGIEPERIRGFVDSFPSGDSFMGREVISPGELAERDYALVIVTSRRAREIADCAAERGIAADKLLFLKNNYSLRDMNRSYDTAARLLGEERARRLCAPCRIVREPLLDTGRGLSERDYEGDWVRVRTLELVCRELGAVPGAAAELGVYKGGFARCINALLPERRLYLFDTFDGFDEAEAIRERWQGRCGEGFVEAHRNTGLDRVMEQMPHPESVLPMPGLFPGSINGLEDSFALISLDADLEQSTLAGLEYFVPRLAQGGYIFLHDYNSPGLTGVRAALRRYEQRSGTRLRTLPLCDVNGTLVICG